MKLFSLCVAAYRPPPRFIISHGLWVDRAQQAVLPHMVNLRSLVQLYSAGSSSGMRTSNMASYLPRSFST